MAEAIRIENVTKRFGEQTAVDDINLTIEQGEFFSLLGPSGCGKTTTLRMLAGFEVPTEGTIRLEGEPVENVPPYKRDVNMVFQSYALFDHLDIADNVAFGLRRKNVAKDEIKRRVADALELVNLSERANARTNELSGGQRQRVGIARALANRPSVLIADEPTGQLDSRTAAAMMDLIASLVHEQSLAAIVTTHDARLLGRADRLLEIADGRLSRSATGSRP